MRRDLLIAGLSLLIGMIIAFYTSIFLIGIDCTSQPEPINLKKHTNQVTLEFNPPK